MFIRAFAMAIAPGTGWGHRTLSTPPCVFCFGFHSIPHGETFVHSLAYVLNHADRPQSIPFAVTKPSEFSLMTGFLEIISRALELSSVNFQCETYEVIDFPPTLIETSHAHHTNATLVRKTMNTLKSEMASLKRTVVTLHDAAKGLRLWSGRQAKCIASIRDTIKILQEPINCSGEYRFLEALVH
jgi:hypothetical protein